ncbi:MAG: hypothetical protein IKE42_15210 [Aquamicrobium sp.]|nr:hypothetical protein [Aquamicrobium sp.]
MTNRISDLNNHLFAQIDRLSKEDLSGEALQDEVARGLAIVKIADAICDNARLGIEAVKLVNEMGDRAEKYLPMLNPPPASDAQK